jgi:cell shape-determining protein MreD
MRIAAQVFLAYGLLLVVGALWRLLPLGHTAPDLVGLSAIYLGLTARHRVAPSVFGAVLIGYLADLLLGAPHGLLAATAGIVCVLGHLVQGRLIVRGRLFTLVFSTLVGVASGTVVLVLRGGVGLEGGTFLGDLASLVVSAALTGLAGPIFFSSARRVDARFARTRRERDAALDGLL